jgi:hypothetical protein
MKEKLHKYDDKKVGDFIKTELGESEKGKQVPITACFAKNSSL